MLVEIVQKKKNRSIIKNDPQMFVKVLCAWVCVNVFPFLFTSLPYQLTRQQQQQKKRSSPLCTKGNIDAAGIYSFIWNSIDQTIWWYDIWSVKLYDLNVTLTFHILLPVFLFVWNKGFRFPNCCCCCCCCCLVEQQHKMTDWTHANIYTRPAFELMNDDMFYVKWELEKNEYVYACMTHEWTNFARTKFPRANPFFSI